MLSQAIRISRSLIPALAALAVLATQVRAQDGANDPSFNPADDGTYGLGASSDVRASVVLPDGKLVIGGSFSTYNNGARRFLARLHADGSLDPAFQTAPGPDGSIETLALQSDGKLIVGGSFTTYDSAPRGGIARVNTDGSLDASFDPGAGAQAYPYVSTVAIQPDGKVIVGGWFTSFDGVPRARIARLNANGSVDATFDPGSGANTVITRAVLQSDGKIVIGGYFTHFGGVSRNRIARLNSDGALDTSFDPGLGALGHVLAVALQSDGKVVVGGDFATIGAIPRQSLARFHPNGALDFGFDPGAGPNGGVRALAIQPDGRLLIGGAISSYQGVPRNAIARVMPDGALDASFAPPNGSNNAAYDLQVLAGGKVLAAGDLEDWAGFERSGVVVLQPTGALDLGFNPLPAPGDFVRQILPQPDGKALVVGAFDYYASVAREGVARIEADGALDLSFDALANDRVSVAALQSDGKALISGWFTSVGGVSRPRMARLESDGTVDLSFDPGAGPDVGAAAIALQPDGKSVVAGSFTSFDGIPRAGIARLQTNGAVDSTFDPLVGVNGHVACLAIQPDGHIVLGGHFTSVGGAIRHRLARLRPDGQLDTSFAPSPGADWSVLQAVLQPDGKILIGGAFFKYNGVASAGIARVNSDGSLDTSFASGPGLTIASGGWAAAYAIRLQPDLKILVGGSFTSAVGRPRRSIARLNPDGTLDGSFPGLPGVGGLLNAIELDSNGRALIGGEFFSYNGAVRHRIARIVAYSPAPVSYCTAGTSTNGCAATLGYSGEPSLASPSGFALEVTQLEGQRPTLLFYGVSGRRADPWAAGSTSFLCVKAPVQRMLIASSGGSAGQCNGSLSADWLAYVAANPSAVGAPFSAGIAVNAQVWYRDPPAPKTVNLSDALEFVTAP